MDNVAAIPSTSSSFFTSTQSPMAFPSGASTYSSTGQATNGNQSQASSAKVDQIAYCYVLPVVCVFGIVGNITNLFTLASPRLKSVSYMYLRALALSDLLCMIFVLGFSSSTIAELYDMPFTKSWLFAFYSAHIMLSLINWALATGVLIVVALSFERFISVVFPMHFRAWTSAQRAHRAIALAYIFPAIMYIPYGIGRHTVDQLKVPNGTIIFASNDSEASTTTEWQIYKWTREGLLRFAPIIIVSLLNLQIMTAFRRRKQTFARLTKRKESSSTKEDTLVYILGGIVAMFFICNIPAAMNLLFINEAVKKRRDYQIFRAFANLLEIINHASQFYVFCACSTDYRTTFLQKFPCFKSAYSKRERLTSLIRRKPTSAANTVSFANFSEGDVPNANLPAASNQPFNEVGDTQRNHKNIRLASSEDDILSGDETELQNTSELESSGTNEITYL